MHTGYKIFPHYTYEDYVQWEGQWELIEGIPYAMAPMPVPNHQIIAANITSEFRMQLKKCNACKVSQPMDYKVSEDTLIQPDMLIVCQEITKKYLDFPPVLVMEILSPATALKDRNNKFYLYEQQGIKYYLIADVDQEFVEIYELMNGSYQLIQKGKAFSHHFSFDLCDAIIDFQEIW